MCPPGVDQTCRGPQRYHLLAPELQQHQVEEDVAAVDVSWRAGFTDFFLAESTPWVWSTLARPVPTTTGCSKGQLSRSKLSALESMPNELLDMVIDQMMHDDEGLPSTKDLSTKENALALGMSSPLLWPIVLHKIHSEYIKAAAPWAGKKIAFQGSYSNDLPPLFHEDGLAASLTPPGRSRMSAARTFNWNAWGYWTSPTLIHQEEHEWMEAANVIAIDAKTESRMRKELSSSRHFPQDRIWLLRNHTLKRFVSSEAFDRIKPVTGTPEKQEYKEPEIYNFHHVLISLISWSDIPVTNDSVCEGVGIHRGSWAGHRLDLVTLDDHLAETDCEWDDSSNDVLRDVDGIQKLLLSGPPDWYRKRTLRLEK